MVTDYTKQVELIKPHEFKDRINVVGCGALGSWIVFFLLKMGFSNIHVYDFDTIEEHNIPNQLFKEQQIGMPKVEAMYEIYEDFFDEMNLATRLTVHNCRIDKTNARELTGITFSAVDSMAGRKEIYNAALKLGPSDLWLDGRLGLWGALVYVVDKFNLEAYARYEDTLYEDEETEVSACGVSQTALPSAVNCASMMIMQMIRHHRGELTFNQIEYQIPELYQITGTWK